MNKSQKKHVVIIGGGFAGMNLANKLNHNKFDVTIVDRFNFHSFPPLFYQVASGGLEPGSICFPFRREFRKRRVPGTRFHLGEVKSVDVAARRVVTDNGSLHYDRLVIAAGTVNNFFGNDDLLREVYTMKSAAEALRLRNDILARLERAAVTEDAALRRRLLTFVIIGGGPTGVEIAGALGEMKRYIIPREYQTIDADEVSIILFEGTDRLLRTMSENASKSALKALEGLMVDVRLGRLMKSYEGGVVTLDDGTTVSADTVIWNAGVTASPIDMTGVPEGFSKGPGGRLVTDEFNRVKGLEDVFAIGDISYTEAEGYPKGYPQLAQPAIQMGKNLARNLNSDSFESKFVYHDKGSMATIGRNKAVADLPKCHFSGWVAWIAWMFIHLISLLGMRNRLVVLINWTWAYFTYASSLRILLSPTRFPLKSGVRHSANPGK